MGCIREMIFRLMIYSKLKEIIWILSTGHHYIFSNGTYNRCIFDAVILVLTNYCVALSISVTLKTCFIHKILLDIGLNKVEL